MTSSSHPPAGFGTYGMRGVDIFEAVSGLSKLGYRGIELCLAPDWPTDPQVFVEEQRSRLRSALIDAGFEQVVFMRGFDPCVEEEARGGMLTRFAADCNIADAPAIYAGTLGLPQWEWDEQRERIAAGLVEMADLGREHNVILAVEPHIGGAFDTPEKANWLMQATDHPSLKLNFDYSHFQLLGMNLAHCMELCMPHAVHTHVKDSKGTPEQFEFLLPGQGDTDYEEYYRLLAHYPYAGMVCVECSGMVFNSPDYDPWEAARWCAGILM
jgi:inosose dehydratase